MTVRTNRGRNILWLADQLRERHLAFVKPVRAEMLRRALDEEHIVVTRAPIRSRAYVDGGDGTFIITARADLRGAELTKVLLHEYAHVHLHLAVPGQTVHAQVVARQLFPCRRGDRREFEADLLAALLWFGPEATPDHPVISKLMAAVDAPALTPPTAPQLPLPLPVPMPVYRPLAEPFESEREYQRKIARRGAKRMRPAVSDRPSTADVERIEFFDPERGTARLTDIAGRRWWVYNYRIVLDGDTKRWELVRDFMSPEIQFRFFVNALGRRQVYRFRDRRERRAYRVKHLDRQLAESTYVPDRLTPRFPTPRTVQHVVRRSTGE